MERCIGIDIGYGFVKITDGQEGYLFPSVVGEGCVETLPRMGLQPLGKTDDLRIAVDGKLYNVGNLAIRHSRLPHRGLSATRMEGNTLKVLLLAALSLFCNQPANSFAVVTGLPPGRMHLMDEILRQVRGEHRVTRMGANGPEDLLIRIDRATVVPQPLGTYWSQVLDVRGKVREESAMVGGTIGIIDVGFRTCDLVTVKDGEYVPEQSRTIPVGLVNAYDEIAAGLLAAHGIERETLALDQAVIKGELTVAGRRVDISELRDRAFEQLSVKLQVELQSAWQVSDYDLLMLTGGGSHAVSRYLLPHLPQCNTPSDPGTANARGYVAWANRLWNPVGTPWTDQRTTTA
jgi:plasmid segregation protein ParM